MDGYDPLKGLRGKVATDSYADKLNGDADGDRADKAGRASRGQTFAQRITRRDCYTNILYGLFAGHPWMNLEQTVIEIPIHGLIKIGGRWEGQDGLGLVTIKGKRLNLLMDHINSGMRAFTHPGGDPNDPTEPYVESVTVAAMEE